MNDTPRAECDNCSLGRKGRPSPHLLPLRLGREFDGGPPSRCVGYVWRLGAQAVVRPSLLERDLLAAWN